MATNYTALTSLSSASAATTATNFLNALKAAITANAAWTSVDDTTLGSGNFRWLAFKCAAASSGLPNDYYVVFVYNPTGNAITVYLGEAYDAVNHVLSGCAPGASSTNVALDSAGRLASSSTLTPNATTGAQSTSGTISPNNFNFGPNTTAIWYLLVVTADHLILGTGSSSALSTAVGYIGGYQTLISPSSNDPYPVVLWNLLITAQTSSTGTPSCPREIPAYWSQSKTYPCSVATYFNGGPALENNRIGYNSLVDLGLGTAAGAAATGAGTYQTSGVLVVGNTSSSTVYANTRGRLNSVLAMTAVPASTVPGDTVTIGTDSWVMLALSAGSYFFTDTGAP